MSIHITHTSWLMRYMLQSFPGTGVDVISSNFTIRGTEAVVRLPLDGKQYRITVEEDRNEPQGG